MSTTFEKTVYNEQEAPSSAFIRLFGVMLPVLATIGMIISGYLTYVHLQNLEPVCGELGECEIVNSSVYSEVNGIPVALFGFVAYAALFVLSLLSLRFRWHNRPLISFTVFCIALAGVLYSAYLTYIELFVLRAICVWCVGSAATISIILVLSVVLLIKGASLARNRMA